jgi:hypothetical protein
MKISAEQLGRALRFPVMIFGMLLVLALLCPVKPAQAVEGAGVCRNGYSGPGCPAASCSVTDLEDCSDSIKDMLMVLCGLVIVAAFAVALFPEILAAAGLGSLLVEAGEGGALGVEVLAEDAAVEETTAAAAEETTEAEAAEATEEATVESGEVTEEASTGSWTSDNANQLQSFFDRGGANLLEGNENCAFVTDEMNGVISTITDGGTPEGYVSPNITWGSLNQPVSDPAGIPNFDQPQFDYFEAMQNQYGGSFQDSTMQNIAQQLGQAGDGAQGIVYVSDGEMGGEAHVFNAVNWDGQTYFVDGQTNQIWTNPDYAAGYENAKNLVVQFLQTR